MQILYPILPHPLTPYTSQVKMPRMKLTFFPFFDKFVFTGSVCLSSLGRLCFRLLHGAQPQCRTKGKQTLGGNDRSLEDICVTHRRLLYDGRLLSQSSVLWKNQGALWEHYPAPMNQAGKPLDQIRRELFEEIFFFSLGCLRLSLRWMRYSLLLHLSDSLHYETYQST